MREESKSIVDIKYQYFWNMLGTISSTAVSIILLLIVSRLASPSIADSFSIAFTLGQQFLVIGLFGVRNFQATDVNESYSFSAYLLSRIITILFMIISSILYLNLAGFTDEKYWTIIFMVLYRSCDALSDVYQGEFQQKQRSDIAGKVLFYRSLLTIIVFILFLLATDNLLFATVSLFLVNLMLSYFLDIRYYRLNFSKKSFEYSSSWQDGWNILKLCLTLFISSFIINYIFNLPKIIIDNYISIGHLGEGLQRDFNILFMPTFVLNLLLMLLRPMLTEISIFLHKGQMSAYKRQVTKIFGALVCLHLLVLVGGYFLGIPVLSFIFGVNLSPYLLSFMILLVGAGLNVYSVMIDNVLTIHRKQYYLLFSTILAFIFSSAITKVLISKFAILGASISFTLTMLVYFLSSLLVYYLVNRKAMGSENNEKATTVAH
ncbi:TPA: lipopolysaccharide biosynthesis protein [Streptococcus suis]